MKCTEASDPIQSKAHGNLRAQLGSVPKDPFLDCTIRDADPSQATVTGDEDTEHLYDEEEELSFSLNERYAIPRR
jgi:hypothetical protein